MADRDALPAVSGPWLEAQLAALVRTPSINPAFDPTSPGEGAIAAQVADVAASLGLQVHRSDAAPGRTSVIATRRGTGGGKALLLYAHHDTVGVSGMPAPFSAEIRDGRLYGRGSYDMKCGLAACLAALHALREVTLRGDVILISVADEEVASIGV